MLPGSISLGSGAVVPKFPAEPADLAGAAHGQSGLHVTALLPLFTSPTTPFTMLLWRSAPRLRIPRGEGMDAYHYAGGINLKQTARLSRLQMPRSDLCFLWLDACMFPSETRPR